MITNLSIAHFKSIRQLDVECKKINLFIGEPNTGKSNILEALALLSWCAQPGPGQAHLSDYVRFELMQNLFHDGLVADQSVEIKMSTTVISPTGLRITLAGDSYDLCDLESGRPLRKVDEDGRYDGSTSFGQREIKFFRFKDGVKQDDKVRCPRIMYQMS